MNKYQEALVTLCDHLYADGDGEIIILSIESLDELVDRATPMKPIRSKANKGAFICPICQDRCFSMGDYGFCPDCGQAIDWSGNND